jgi:heme-degrading monooxygenase HmoA
MSYLVIRHKVKDYAKWKAAFDAHASTRKAQGSKGGQLLRDTEKPTDVVIVLEWDNLDKARAFSQSDDLRKTMERAGVIGKPDVFFLEESESISV